MNTNSKIGYLEYIQEYSVFGWCFSGTPGIFESIAFEIDEQFIGETIADQYRPDLESAGYNRGACGFVWRIPTKYLDGTDHLIAAHTSDGTLLNNSPLQIRGLPLAEVPNPNTEAKTEFVVCDLANLFVSTELDSASKRRQPITKGKNQISEGWAMYSASEDTDHVHYWPTVMEMYAAELVDTVLRIHASKPVKLLRLFGELQRPDCFFILPFTLTFHFGNLSKEHTARLAIRLVSSNHEDKIDTHFKTVVNQPAAHRGEVSVRIPADIVNRIPISPAHRPSVIFEFNGQVNVELGRFRFGLSAQPLLLAEDMTGSFEDPVIVDQYAGLNGFFEAGDTPPTHAQLPIWRAAPQQGLPEIVVPVYDALAHVQVCLRSLAQHTDCPHLLTIVNDGSSPETAKWLDAFAEGKPWVKVLHNSQNIGYTRTINRAIREATGNAVILLNSDTEVSPCWLNNLMSVANSDPDIGLVGPLSNAASWQSVPKIKDKSGAWAINPLPPRCDVADFAAQVAAASQGQHPAVPILNGFCLYIKRDVFERIGLFDEETFPQGYGEENDFCFRAIDAGYTLRVVTDTYVYHAKTKSFGTERRQELIKGANKILHERYGKARFDQLEKELAEQPVLSAMRAALQVNSTKTEA